MGQTVRSVNHNEYVGVDFLRLAGNGCHWDKLSCKVDHVREVQHFRAGGVGVGGLGGGGVGGGVVGLGGGDALVGFSSLGNGFSTDASGSSNGAVGGGGGGNPSFDLNDFPSLGGGAGGGNNSSSTPGGNDGLAAALRQQL